MEEMVSSPAPRTPLNMEILFKKNYAREESRGRLKNISLSGAFIEFDGEAFRANEKLNLRFKVEGRERKIACTVVWANSLGCGIKFIPANNRDVQIVDDLIYFVENSRSDRRSMIDQIFKKVG